MMPFWICFCTSWNNIKGHLELRRNCVSFDLVNFDLFFFLILKLHEQKCTFGYWNGTLNICLQYTICTGCSHKLLPFPLSIMCVASTGNFNYQVKVNLPTYSYKCGFSKPALWRFACTLWKLMLRIIYVYTQFVTQCMSLDSRHIVS